ncbi:MAG: hypothetical protein DYG89_32010 [Caldilinea sp. CFX5]|nr:hypothetical protein [Caldilinea sp. CFX5]
MRCLHAVRRLKSAIKRSRWFCEPKALILIYHRIADESLRPNWLAVSPDNFAGHLAYIRQRCRPLRLLELVEAIQKQSVPDRSVVVTFDDGYRDNLTQALPLLEANQVPASVFVTTGFVDNQREFWWDDLARLIQSAHNKPPSLTLTVQGRIYHWATDTEQQRQQTRLELDTLIAPLPAQTKEALLNELARWSGLPRDVRPAYRTMTAAELQTLAQSPYIDIGAHTVTHPLLPTLSLMEQRDEICRSSHQLAALLQRPIHAFAYPNGAFTDETAQIVRDAGFCAACTTRRGAVQNNDDCFLLRRYNVNDWDIATFQQHLESWFQA